MKNKIISAAEAVAPVRDGDFLMVGGFVECGYPGLLVQALTDASSAKDLTVLSNDTVTTDGNFTPILLSGRISRVYASYIGLNAVTSKMHLDGLVTLIPQGTLAEKVRMGGAGIGGFLTPTGVGTVVEKGKTKITLNCRDYLLEESLTGDVGFVRATIADKAGNLHLRGTTKNFNSLIPAACRYVVAEAETIVEVGELDPELVNVPGILVDAIVKAGENVG